MNVEIWGWDTPNTAWVKVLVDESGHLQVDVLSTVMDADAATEATLNLVRAELDGIEGLLGSGLDAGFDVANDWLSRINAKLRGGLPSILDDDTLKVTEQGTPAQHCYAWSGEAWEKLQFEDIAYLNLKVKLYDQDNAIISDVADGGTIATTHRGLVTIAAIYGWDGTISRPLLVDNLGHAQVDVLTLPLLDCRIYGYDGENWQTLLVESAANPNLRVKLYDGATEVSVLGYAFGVGATHHGLVTGSCTLGLSGVTWTYMQALTSGLDGVTNSQRGLIGYPRLTAFNGEKWDRLRTYGVGVLKVGRAPIGATTLRVTGTGQVGTAAAKKLYWVACSPDSPSAEWELSDATEALQAVVYDHFDSDKHSEHLVFDPPMEFANGIWVEKFDHMHSLVFCYE